MTSQSLQDQIYQTLSHEFEPTYLEIKNESDQHSGPPGRESHFKVHIVSEHFKDMNRIERQRKVFEVLKSIMTKVHALALRVQTQEEFSSSSNSFKSPDCTTKSK